MPVLGQLGEGEVPSMAPANALIPGEGVPAPYPSSITPKMTSEPPSGYDPGALHIFPPLCLYSEQVSLHVNLSRASLSFPQPSSSSKCKPHWSSKPNVMRAHLPCVGTKGIPRWDLEPSLHRGTSTVVIFLPLVGHAVWVRFLSRLHL